MKADENCRDYGERGWVTAGPESGSKRLGEVSLAPLIAVPSSLLYFT